MFEGFSAQTIDFLWGLRLNNEKPWFEAHRAEFTQHLQLPMKALASAVFEQVAPDCEGRGMIHKVSRIYRDARRLHGGGPYRDNMWFSIERPSEEWTATPVFWFELTPETWRYGLGYYSAKAATMAKLRARIDRNPAGFEALVAPLEASGEFVPDGQEYARKKQAPTEKTAGWYNRRSVSVLHEQACGPELYSPDFAAHLACGMRKLLPLYDYLITLDSDPTPM